MSRRLAKASVVAAVVTLVIAVAGFITVLVLNAFFLDKYNAYGEVPIPGSGSVHLPAGEVTVSLHALVIGDGGALPVPPLGITIKPPEGMPQPVVTESIGSTTTVNNDAHVRVWMVHVAAEGTYDITTDGQINGYINPRLAFGHQSSYGYLVWVFVAVFVIGLIDLALSVMWLSRTRRTAVSAMVARPAASSPYLHDLSPPPATPYEPTDEGVRVERLKNLAALRDSGALTQEEFEAEKRRILYG